MSKIKENGKKYFALVMSILILVTSVNLQTISFFAAEIATEQEQQENEEPVIEIVDNAPEETVEVPELSEPELETTEVVEEQEVTINNVNTKKEEQSEKMLTRAEELVLEGYVEDIEERTLESKTFVKDGISETIIYLGPIHFEEDGKIEDYDLSLNNEEKQTINPETRSIEIHEGYKISKTDSEVFIPSEININSPLEYQINDTSSFTLVRKDMNLKNPIEIENGLQFGDTSIIPLQGGLRTKTTYNEKLPESLEYEMVLPDGYKAVLSDTEVSTFVVEEATDTIVYEFGIPSAYDANRQTINIATKMELTEVDEKTFSIVVPLATIVTPIPAFPVNLDETPVNIDPNQVTLFGVNAVNGTQTYGPGQGTLHSRYLMLGHIGPDHAEYYHEAGFYSGVSQFNFDFANKIGRDREIIEAKYHLFEATHSGAVYSSDRGLYITLGRLEGSVNPVTYDNLKNVGTTTNDQIRVNKYWVTNGIPETYVQFDIKEAVEAWSSGLAKNYGLRFIGDRNDDTGLLFANHHVSNYQPDDFDSNDIRPHISIRHQKAEPIPADYSLDDTTVNLRPFTSWEKDGVLHFQALGFDGVATPDSEVELEVYEKETNNVVFKQSPQTTNGFRMYPYYEPTLYPDIPQAQKYYGLKSDWQAYERLMTADLKKNVHYGVRVRAHKKDTSGNIIKSGKWNEGDTFQLYTATDFDRMVRVLNFYGITDRVLFMQDNHMGDELIVAKNEMFIRNPKKNQGKAYTSPPLSEEDKKNIDYALIGRGKHCEFGYEPINLNTGNFYYTNDDVTWFDFDDRNLFTRSYNSMASGADSIFGRNWSFTWDKQLTFMQNDAGSFDALYADGTGKRLTFPATGVGTFESPWGEQMTLERVYIGDKTVEEVADYYDVVEQTPVMTSFTLPQYNYVIKTKNHEVFTFNTEGYLIEAIVDAYNHKFTLDYDTNNLLTKITTSSGKVFDLTYNTEWYVEKITGPDSIQLAYTYDALGNLTSFKDSEGFVMNYEYKDTANPYMMTSYLDRENHDAIINNTYDKFGRVVKQLDAKGDTVTFKYNTDHTEITSFNGEKEYVYFDAFKRTSKYIGKDGIAKTFTYDSNNNMLSEDDGMEPETAYTYDARGNVTTETRADGLTKTYIYAGDVPVEVINFDGTSTYFTYDAQDNLLSATYSDGTTIVNTYDTNGQTVSEKDRNGNVVSFGYDAAGNKVSETDGHGTKTIAYDAFSRITSETDALGYTTSYVRNKRGELLEERKPTATLKYTYDADGQKVYEVDGNGNGKSFTYDAWSRVIAETDSYGTKSFTFDSFGNMLTETDELGYTTKHTYDDGGRLLETVNPDGSKTSNTYDAKGRLETSTNELGLTTTYAYDAVMGRKISETNHKGQATTYEYDVFGNIIKTTYPDGLTEENSYDIDNRLIESTDKRGLVTTYTYDANGNEISQTINGEKTTSKQLGKDDVVVSETDVLGHTTHTEYNAGKLATLTTLANGVTQAYEYDGAYQVTKVTDPLGNSTETTYDANGNVLVEMDELGHTKTFTYTSRNQVATETAEDGGITQHVYDAKGQEIETIDPLGHSTYKVYDNMGREVQTTDALGNVTQTIYNNVGQKVKTIDAAGRETKYTYTADGLEETTLLPTKKKTENIYDAFDRVIETKDNWGHFTKTDYNIYGETIKTENEKGEVTKKFYDVYGRQIETIDMRGNSSHTEYDLLDNVVKETDPKGNTTETIFNAIGQTLETIETTSLGSVTTSNAYDPVTGLMSETTTNGNTSSFVYDAKEQIIEQVTPRGFTLKFTYTPTGLEASKTDANGNTTTNIYDKKGQTIEVIDPLGNSTKTVYDANGQVVKTYDELNYTTEQTYDALGQTIESIDKRGNKTTFEYDIFGNKTVQNNPDGSQATFKFDNQGREIERRNAACESCGTSGAYFKTEYDKFDRKKASIHPNGYEEYYTYNEFGDITETTNNLGETMEQNTYDAFGRKVAEANALGEVTRYELSSNDKTLKTETADGLVTESIYNNLSQEVQTIDVRGNVTEMVYDADDNIVEMHFPNGGVATTVYDGNNNVVAETDSLGNTRSYAYDGNNKPTTVTDELGFMSTTTYTARGEKASEIDALGNTMQFEYDPNGNISKEIDQKNEVKSYGYDNMNRLTIIDNRLGFKTNYTYDKYNNVITVRDARGNAVDIKYDAMNNEIERKNPDNTKEKKAYDKKNNLIEEINGNRKEIRYTYDALNRETSKSFDGKTITFDHNLAGQVTSAQTVESEKDDKVTTLNYTPYYQVESTVDEKGNQVSYTYDNFGRRESVTYPDGTQVFYQYDINNQLAKVSSHDGDTTYVFDARGQLVEETLPNNTTMHYSYDAVGQNTLLENVLGDGEIQSSFDYTYDEVGNQIEVHSIVEAKETTQKLSYDAEEQLIHSMTTIKNNNIATTKEVEYSYDRTGNKLGEITTTNGVTRQKQFAFDKGNKLEEQTSEFGVKYTYDDAGNVIKKKHKTTGLEERFTYSSLGQLLEVEASNGKVIKYEYDGLGERISKEEITDIEKSSNNEFLNFIKEDTFNEDYDLQLRKQTTSEQLRNLRDTMREVKDEAADGKTCPVADEDASKQSRIEFTYINDVTLENAEVLQVQSQIYTPYETFVYGVNRISRRTYKDKMNYYQYDGRGSVIGQQKQQNTDDLYYKITYNDFGKPNRKLDDEYGFNGESHDYNGSQYLRARFYDTNTGRFDARDTYLGDKEDPISQNRYAYVWNNPSKYTDPSGHYASYAAGEKEFNQEVRIYIGGNHYKETPWECARWKVAQRAVTTSYYWRNSSYFHRHAKMVYNELKNNIPSCAGKVDYGEYGTGYGTDDSDVDAPQAWKDWEAEARRRAEEARDAKIAETEKWLTDIGVNAKGRGEFSSAEEYLRYLEKLKKMCEELQAKHLSNEEIADIVNNYIKNDDNFLSKLIELENITLEYTGYDKRKTYLLMGHLIARLNPDYSGLKWELVLGPTINAESYIGYIQSNYRGLYNFFKNYSSVTGYDLEHHMATLIGNSYWYSDPTDITALSGWGGDLQTLANDLIEYVSKGKISIRSIQHGYEILQEMGAFVTNKTSFSSDDLLADIDARNLAIYFAADSMVVAWARYSVYSYSERKRLFVDSYGGKNNLRSVAYDVLNKNWPFSFIRYNLSNLEKDVLVYGFIAQF